MRVETESAQPLTLQDVRNQVNRIQEIMRDVMKKGEHYDTLPDCEKPCLLKPGAEKLCLTFRMAPKYDVILRQLADGHREYEVVCYLYHIYTGVFLGSGVGLCSTQESKYAYRNAERKCPMCGKTAIIRGQKKFGGGWVCWKKKGGCGAKFPDGDKGIEGQDIGKVPNPNIADTYNTVLKIGKKRAHVDASLTVTAASDIFTQDLEDMHEVTEQANPAPAKPEGKEVKQKNTSGLKGDISEDFIQQIQDMSSKLEPDNFVKDNKDVINGLPEKERARIYKALNDKKGELEREAEDHPAN